MVTVIGCVVISFLLMYAIQKSIPTKGDLVICIVVGLMVSVFALEFIKDIAIMENTDHYIDHSKPKKLINKMEIEYRDKIQTFIQYKDGKDTARVLLDKYSTETKYGKTPEVVIHYHIKKVKKISSTWKLFYPSDIKSGSDTTQKTYTLYLPSRLKKP